MLLHNVRHILYMLSHNPDSAELHIGRPNQFPAISSQYSKKPLVSLSSAFRLKRVQTNDTILFEPFYNLSAS